MPAALVWVLIVAALARPERVGDAVTHEVSARDLILAVDISGSMEQSDFRTQDGKTLKRLDGVKLVLGDFIARRKGDRVALILFGSKAYVQVPFTQDLQTARMLLDQSEVGMAGQQTVIGDTIGLAIKTLETSTAQAEARHPADRRQRYRKQGAARACRRHCAAKRRRRLYDWLRRSERHW